MDNKKVNKEEVVESLFEMLSNGNLSDSNKETIKNAIKLLLTNSTTINNFTIKEMGNTNKVTSDIIKKIDEGISKGIKEHPWNPPYSYNGGIQPL